MRACALVCYLAICVSLHLQTASVRLCFCGRVCGLIFVRSTTPLPFPHRDRPGPSFTFQHGNHKGSPLPDLHGDTAPPCPMLHRAASRAGEPLAGLAVPHLRTELSATSQIRIAALPHLHRDRAFSCRICTLSRSPTVECPFSVLLLHSLPRWMPELPLKLVSHAILLSPYCHTAASGLDSPRHGLRSPRLESGEAAC